MYRGRGENHRRATDVAAELYEHLDATLLSHCRPRDEVLLLGDWKHPYSKEKAFFPLKGYPNDKYWPPVARVDNVFGDRNLVCTCPPMANYMEAAE